MVRRTLGRHAAACLLLTVFALVPFGSMAQEALAINHVVVDERLHTAGQPSAEVLGTLAARGFDTVINLAPPTVAGAVDEEQTLLEASGVRYVNIPVDFRAPTHEDFERFSEALREARAGHVLVHCQINARASTFTFLYRVVHEGVSLTHAFEHVQAVWTPIEPWAQFAAGVLASHGIAFDLP